jgi:HPr kinase/phosphorylase
MSAEIREILEISVAKIIKKAPKRLMLEVLAGETELDDRLINSSRIQKLGLALAGYQKYIHRGRIQMIGGSEVSYLSQLEAKAKTRAVENLDLNNIVCILVTKNLDLPLKLLERLRENEIPVLRTPLVSSEAIRCLSGFLQKVLAPKITIHGVMLGMYGHGILIIGESGIGKSECALDLIRSGHRLISDDSVRIKKIGDFLEGSSPKLTHAHLEIRGLGILNIKDLFGVAAIGQNRKIDLCIELKNWKDVVDIDRLGIKKQEQKIFDIKIPKFVLPVSSGRNITTLVETAVRVHLLKVAGHDAAQKFFERHNFAVSGKKDI